MTPVAEVHKLDDDFAVARLARFVVTAPGAIDVVELAPGGAALGRGLLEEPLVDPFGQTVTAGDGVAYLMALRWARSSDALWVTPVVELPGDEARDPAALVAPPEIPHVPATLPYPEPPAALAGVRVVEVRRPAADDWCRSEVVARLVAAPGAEVEVEGPDADEVAQVRLLVDLLGRPPLDGLAGTELAPGLAAAAVRLDEPGDLAWRDGLVGARRAARDAGDAAAVTRLDLEFTTRLPRIWLSRCPFTGELLRLAVDGWGFDSPYWDPQAPVRPLGDEVPATFLGLAGTLGDGGAPPVFASLLGDDPQVRAVLSAVRVGGRRCDLVAYFARPRPGGPPPFREWGTDRVRVLDGAGGHWAPAPAPDPPVATDLATLLVSGRLSWIVPFDMGAELRSGPDGCPWLPA